MISILLAVTIVALFWIPVEILLRDPYDNKYSTVAMADYHIERDMKRWSPVVVLLLVLVLPTTALTGMAIVGVCLELYLLIYVDGDDMDSLFRRLFGRRD